MSLQPNLFAPSILLREALRGCTGRPEGWCSSFRCRPRRRGCIRGSTSWSIRRGCPAGARGPCRAVGGSVSARGRGPAEDWPAPRPGLRKGLRTENTDIKYQKKVHIKKAMKIGRRDARPKKCSSFYQAG